MKNDVIRLYITKMLIPIETMLRQNKFKNKKEKQEIQDTYLRVLKIIENEIEVQKK